MTSAATWIISLTAAAGTILGLWHLRPDVGRPRAWMGIMHGIAGTAGLAILLLALRGPERGIASGVGAFGTIAAWLFAAAAATGVLIWIRRRKGPAGTMIVHAGIAIAGWVMLLAWNSLGQ
jgi:hypothetical protein